MTTTLAQAHVTKRNSLNFLRLVLALMVVFSHSITLGGFGSETILGKSTLGTMAVFGFFGISGYLIAGSADRNNAGRYLWQRFLRIFPAFWICLVVTAFVFGTIAWFHSNPGLAKSCGIHCYLTEPQGPFDYVRHNFWLQVNQETITGTVQGGFTGFGWNQSLWTLEIEFACYLLLAAFSLLGLLKRRALVAVIAAAAWVAEIVINSNHALAMHLYPLLGWDWISVLSFHVETAKVLVLVPIFLSGTLLYLYREKIPDSGALALGSAALVLAGFALPVGRAPDYFQTSNDFTAVFLAYPLIWLGIHLPFSKVGAVNDYSYGIYIYAFPIQQLLAMWGVNRWGYVTYTLATLVVLLPFAVGSWWLVEKHALKLKTLPLPKRLRFWRPVPQGSNPER